MAKQQQKLNHINAFTKGMMQDLDINKIPPQYYFTGEDIKLLDKKGQGFILTNVDGNEYAFVLSDDFIPLASREHKDVLYIVSCDIKATGIGEIGTFPSINPISGEWELMYRPLRNYTDVYVTNIFRTVALNLQPEHRVELEIKDHYDNTVNLYLADGVNQLRSINSGFTQDGEFTFEDASPPYDSDNIDTKINLILSTKTTAEMTVTSVTVGGALKFGTYIFFYKYLTEDLDDTYWIGEASAVPILRGISSVGAVRGGAADDLSDKKVRLSISNPDTTYKYIKIGYLRHFSDYNGVATYEFGEISSRYDIDDAATIDVIGTEGETFLQEEEIMLAKESEIIPASIVQLANRLWGAKWKKIQTHDDSLSRFAGLIKITHDSDTILDDPWSSRDTAITYGQYLDWQNYTKKGYFRGEAYPFGVVFELNDGSVSQAYPLTGVDQWDDLVPDYDTLSNELGIFRFPNGNLFQVSTVDGELKVALVKMDVEDAFLSIMGANENNWIRFNVRAIYFVRGDRYKNMMYQGLMIGAAAPFLETAPVNGYELTECCSIEAKEYQDDQNISGFAGYSYFQRYYRFSEAASYFASADVFWGHLGSVVTNDPISLDPIEKWGPIFRGYAPSNYINPDSAATNENRNFATRYFLKPDKYCFYSPDMLIQPFNDVDDANYVFRLGKTILPRDNGGSNNNPGSWAADTSESTAPQYSRHICYGAAQGVVGRNAYIDKKVLVGEDGFVRPGDSGYNDFINSAEEPYLAENHYWYWDGGTLDNESFNTFNRSMRMAKYLGIDFSAVDVVAGTLDPDDDFNLDIVNIYTADPASIQISNLFPNANSIQYKKISGPLEISTVVAAIVDDNWDAYKTGSYGGGDCFLQRTFFKQLYWAGSSYYYYKDNAEWDSTDLVGNDSQGGSTRKYAHGTVLSIVTENEHNIAARSVDGNNTFYPATEISPFAYEVYNEENAESFKLNLGYDKHLSTNIYLAYDVDLPEKDLEYITRVKYSDAVIPGSYIDAYRSFRVNNYQDFDTNFGPIMSINKVYDRLVSIHEDAIVEHYINERITQNTDGGSPVLGYGDVLSASFRKMANFGTQHKWSVVEGDQLYGVDWKRRILWEVGLARSDSGSLYLDARDLTKEAYVQQWMREVSLDISDNRTDKVNIYGDNTMLGEGIVSGYDDYSKDVYFIFHKRIENV